MVITVEPGTVEHLKLSMHTCRFTYLLSTGVYVPASPSFPKQFHNIGIRIEVRTSQVFVCCCSVLVPNYQDEVLVQKDHAVVLSVDAPKEVCLQHPIPTLSLISFMCTDC